jgi:hypothetical protein
MERDFDEDMMKAVKKGDANEVAELLENPRTRTINSTTDYATDTDMRKQD